MTIAKPAVTGHVKVAPASSAVASIMVHVDWNAGSDERIRLAANLADRFGAVSDRRRRLGAGPRARDPFACRS